MTLLLLCGVSSAWADSAKYIKVTSTSDLADGQYLIVCEDQNVAFNSALTTLDAPSNTVAVSPANGEIAYSADLAKAAFTFTASNGSFLGTGGNYFGNASNSNGLTSSPTALSNTVSINDGNADIVSAGGAYLRYNSTKDQWRFRYFKSSTYTGQKAIQLYKYVATITPTIAYTVTFNAGTNGACSTVSLTEASAGAGVTLPSCTANTGYVFKGWSTTENGTTPNAGKAGETYNPTSNCTLYAVYAKTYVLTITQPTDGGTLSVTDGTNTLNTGDEVEVGTNLTCKVTDIPEGKRFSRFYVTYDGGENKYKSTNPATFDNIPTEGITAATVTVKYQDLEKYTINYMINGVNVNPQENVYEGTALTFPEVPNTGSKVFVGWAEATIEGTINTKPLLISTTGLTAKTNNTYYAVFANLIKGSSTTVTDVINHDFAGVENQDDGTGNLTKVVYTDWSNKAGTSGAVYAGQTAGNYNSVQMRSDKNNSGIITTTSGGRVKSITVEWKSETVDGRTLNIYGKGSAYTSPTELYSSTNRGDLIGTIVKGTSTTLNITDDYTYIALRSNNGAMYLTSISIAWEQGTPDTYSDYCTTLPDYNTVVVGASGYATYSSETYTVIPDPESGVQLFGAKINDEGTAVTLIPTAEGQAIGLKGEGFIVKATPNTTVFIEKTGENVVPIEGNQLVGTVHSEYDLTQGEAYLLSATSDGTPFFGLCKAGTLAANKAFLPVPSSGVKAILAIEEGGTTGISTIKNAELNIQDAIYNLAGQKVGADYKGIVIRNGKKMLNK